MSGWRRFRAIGSIGAAVAVAIVAAACGTAGGTGAGSAGAAGPAGRSSGHARVSLVAPAGWSSIRLRSGAVLSYPPGWRAIEGDPGSASAALMKPDGTIIAYLNATRADRDETLANWTHFRLSHNAAENRDVRLISAQPHGRIGMRLSSCVTDQYLTTRTSYRELACIVRPPSGGSAAVLVAAAAPNRFARERSVFELAFRRFAS